MTQRRGGVDSLHVAGVVQDAKGTFTHNLGGAKRTAVVGVKRPLGYKEETGVPFISGKISDRAGLNVRQLIDTTDATVTLSLGNGKVFILRNAWWAGGGDIDSDEGDIDARFEGLSGEEVA